MNNKQHKLILLIVLIGTAYGLLPVAIAKAADLFPPQMTIDQVSEQMKLKLGKDQVPKDFAGVTEVVEEIIYPNVDFNRVSALVLGKHWRTASKDQKLRFRKEFQLLLVRTYARAFTEFNDWTVSFLPMKMKDGSNKALVKTEVLQPGRPPVAVSYRMRLSKGKWKVYDIIIEGVSLVTNYRNSFKNEVKRSGSLDAVIEKLAERNEKALAPSAEKNS
jgi:phospholipid transport system substrate-binding protein